MLACHFVVNLWSSLVRCWRLGNGTFKSQILVVFCFKKEDFSKMNIFRIFWRIQIFWDRQLVTDQSVTKFDGATRQRMPGPPKISICHCKLTKIKHFLKKMSIFENCDFLSHKTSLKSFEVEKITDFQFFLKRQNFEKSASQNLDPQNPPKKQG